jgi:hypothetical protein
VKTMRVSTEIASHQRTSEREAPDRWFFLRGPLASSGPMAGRRSDHLVSFLMILKGHSHGRRPNYESSTSSRAS